MKSFRKICAGILAAGMCISVLGGCGENTTDNAKKRIRIWTGDTGSRTMFEQVVKEFNETTGKKNGIEVVYEAKGNLGDSLAVALQTNQAPEFFMGGSAAEYSEQGYITAIEDLPGGAELVKQYEGYLTEGKQTYNGKTYSLPFAASGTYGLIYNKDMFKKAGIVDEKGEAKPPKTYSELRQYAKLLTDTSKNRYGIVLPLKWGGWFDVDVRVMSSVNSGHYGYDYTTGEYDYSYLKPMMEMLMGIKEDKSYMPGAEGLDNDPARARFAEGNIGMKFGVSWDVAVFNDQFPAKCDWGVAPLPVADENVRYAQQLAVNTGIKISANGVKAFGEDKIMTVYKWIVSDETAKKLYELGAYIPFKSEILDGADTKKFKKGWRDFSEMVKISKTYPAVPNVDTSGETLISENFLNNVWTGKMSVDEAIAQENCVQTEGRDKYKELHSDYDVDSFIVKDWNALLSE